MRIAGTEVNLQHKALEVYVAGCKVPHCVGCHNPELWSFQVGDLYPTLQAREKLQQKIEEVTQYGLIEYAWVLGGEPLDQNVEHLLSLIDTLRNRLKVMLWTHYDLDHVSHEVLRTIDYLKTGRYVRGGVPYVEPLLGVKLANEQQKIIKIS